MDIVKIVVTGGPCSGKTSCLKYLRKELTKLGFKVILINESATEIMDNGLNYKTLNSEIEFQKSVLKLQILKEKFYEETCRNLSDEKVILICDRGTMDGKAYLSSKEFEKLLKELCLNEIELRDNYDAVFHLETTANGAESFYNKSNNLSRREDVGDAKNSDTKTLCAWIGTPHLRVINTTENFDNKIKILLKQILAVLGHPEPVEIERKFLIEKPNEAELLLSPFCKKVDIVQTYLESKNGDTERVRKRGNRSCYNYTHTIKKRISDRKRIEIENQISKKEYEKLLEHSDKTLKTIKKSRYCLIYSNKYFEIDVFPFIKKTAFLEIELLDENEEFEIPEFIKVIKEVTDDKNFSNRSIAKKIPDEMK